MNAALGLERVRVRAGGLLGPWLLVLLPLLFYLVPMLWVPLEPDEAVYGVVARGLLDGQVPYRDLFDHKPPPVYAWYALSFVLFGDHQHAPRILAALTLCGSALALFHVARAMFDERRAWVLTAAFGAGSGAVLAGFNANTEVFALLPALASLALVIDPARRRSPRLMLLAGALSALAVWTRPVVLPAQAVLGLWLVAEGVRTRTAWPAAAHLAGGLLTVPLVVGPFVLAGALSEFVWAVITYQRLYYEDRENAPWAAFSRTMPTAVLAFAPFVMAGYLGLCSIVARRRLDGARLLFLLWAAGMLVGQFLTGRYYPHYAALMLPALVLLGGFLGDSGNWRLSPRSPLAWTLGVGLFLGIFVNVEAYQDVLAAGHPHRQAAALGREVGRQTCPGQPIWEFGRSSIPYFYADRSSPTRFIYERPFWLDPATLPEAVADLRERPPVLILDTFGATQPAPWLGIEAEVDGRYYPQPLAGLLAERYDLEGVERGAAVYRLRDEHERCDRA